MWNNETWQKHKFPIIGAAGGLATAFAVSKTITYMHVLFPSVGLIGGYLISNMAEKEAKKIKSKVK